MPRPPERPPPLTAPRPGGSTPAASDDLARELHRFDLYRGDHIARYRWVAERLRGGSVLEVGCGHGFGAHLLGGRYDRYLGVDVDAEAIAWAARVVARAEPKAEFRLGSVPEAASRFDAVVCFEVLEHVADPGALLARIREACAPGGAVFLSTPNGTLSAGRPEWFMSPFHVAEYTPHEFERLVRGAFPDSGEFFAQRRLDGLDWILPALRSRLRASAPTSVRGPGAPTNSVPPTLRQAHGWFRQIPSPAAVWRLSRIATPARPRSSCSHLLWRGTAGPRPG